MVVTCGSILRSFLSSRPTHILANRGVQKHGLEFFSFSKRAFTELHRLVIVMHCCHLGCKVRIENLGRRMVSNSVVVIQ